nr:ankyrin repeat family protein [Oriental turtle dovepox virus]
MDFIYSDKNLLVLITNVGRNLSFQKSKIGSDDSNLLKCVIFKNYKENFPIYRYLIKNYIN